MSKPRKVAKYTLEGEFIRTFDSAAEAERVLGYEKNAVRSQIGNCCKLKQTFSCGYRWLYADDIPRAKEIFEQRPIYDAKEHTFQEILEAAAGCRTKSEFRRKNKTLHSYAYDHGWLDKLGFERAISPYKDNCYTVYAIPFYVTNTVYVGLTDNMERRWADHNNPNAKSISGALKYSLKTGIPMPDYPLIIEENLYAIEALYLEDFFADFYRELGMKVLNVGKTGLKSGSLGGWYKIRDMEIFEAAATCETRKEFSDKFPKLCAAAYKRKITSKLGFRDCKVKDGTYTEKYCYKIASGCKTTKELIETDKTAYQKAQKEGWLVQYWWLYDKRGFPVITSKGFKVKIYKNQKSFISQNNINSSTLWRYLRENKKYNGMRLSTLDISDIEFDIPDFEHRFIA